ncbi:anaerobic glycerol-3-phosphate dehydrogenase subunit B [Pseudodesulfovibrio sp. JC047]|uniref:glycerol-3-phosphate dehydrogenase subunit GlpB n=1 Tax=Pseudodesulfovibrio sp. JC047 TaxID=2683199 RepID=UPI0013D70478|nr:glycerol-3-phosphate dehydrogenase subunit GlpB [Pseudodesulfovibrio sp. JC047]NDV18638.1 anaerobic glycerol-3-phosphate dehydrogenase subunit B [Pseudodesulfovibrio sp. JC047]
MTGRDTLYDVMVIGAGFAGMAASLFAARHGLNVVQTGATGGIDFSTGFIDLMGVHPVEDGKRWGNPWAAIEAVVRDCPDHPYARLSKDEIAESINCFTEFLTEQGLEYVGHTDRNICSLTPAGTVKRTYRVPETAWNGSLALERKAPTLLVDFHGLKGVSGAQIVETQKQHWPGVKAVRVAFPGGRGELYPEHMAWALADPAVQQKMMAEVLPHAEDIEYIGFPAVLGLNDPGTVVRHLAELSGKRIFEIPTIPPSIAGPRLRAVFDRGLPGLGVRTLSQKLVTGVTQRSDGGFDFQVGSGPATVSISAKKAILATGRFFGKGLRADREKVVEPIFDVPVVQPAQRDAWHNPAFFAKQGHPINRAGVEVDARLRPIGPSGEPLHDTLFAAGAILAHHDWMRMKCGAGLAIATAFRAVKELMR